MGKQFTVVIADDNIIFRESIRLVLSSNDHFLIVGEATNGEEAIQLANQLLPDIIIMDINMSPVNGFEATRKIMKQLPQVKIIGFSLHKEASYCKNMMRLGAKGYLTKSAPLTEIMAAIKEIADGGRYIDKDIIGTL
jgi:two-component system, NarL family, invasion response regulator UvrY